MQFPLFHHLVKPVHTGGQIWAGAMMLQHLGYGECHDTIMAAVERVLREGSCLTRDMGGTASTGDMGAAIAAAL